MNTVTKFALPLGCLIFAGATLALAQGYSRQAHPPGLAQVVALDECDPATFNAKLGPDFCHNVTLGAFTTFDDLFAKAAAGTPDPGWDFEPDVLKIKEGTTLNVVDQGGEPHTFTEVKKFGGGFIPDLNAGEDTVPECAGGFSNVAVAKTRILQGSQIGGPTVRACLLFLCPRTKTGCPSLRFLQGWAFSTVNPLAMEPLDLGPPCPQNIGRLLGDFPLIGCRIDFRLPRLRVR